MLLKRIPGLTPEQTASIQKLGEVGITTTDHLLATSYESLAAVVGVLLTESQLRSLVKLALSTVAPTLIAGSNVGPSKSSWQGFGLDGLDSLIPEQVGGWQGTGIIELAGTKSTGKTLFALHLVLRQLIADELATCHWIDVDGSFSSNRLKGILELWEIEDVAGVLSRISVHPCFSLERDMPAILDTISTGLEDAEEGRVKSSVLVVEPITDLFKNVLNNSSAQGHAMMVTLLEDLAELTHTHGLLTILLNTTVSSLPTNPNSAFSTTSIKPALGSSFTFFVDLSLLLQDSSKVFPMDEGERERARSKDGGMRGVAEVLKNRFGPSGLWVMFETDGIQLQDVIADTSK